MHTFKQLNFTNPDEAIWGLYFAVMTRNDKLKRQAQAWLSFPQPAITPLRCS